MRRGARIRYIAAALPVVAALAWCLYSGSMALLRPDQKGMRLYRQGDYRAAAAAFAEPQWKGVAFYRDASFKEAAGVFAGIDSARMAFNHGNSLVMQGKYEAAIKRFERALQLEPDREDAAVNLEIARARAALLVREGGEMTGGKLAADEIVFSEGSSSNSSAGEEVVEEAVPMSDSELQAMWLRQVQTKPADFLRAKFSYQFARDQEGGGEAP